MINNNMKFNKLYNLILEINAEEIVRAQESAKARKQEYTNFGPLFTQERTYFDVKVEDKQNKEDDIKVPDEIVSMLDMFGYEVLNYKQGLAVKKEDKIRKNVYKIGKLISKGASPETIKKFEGRLKNLPKVDLESMNFQIVITHKAEDVAGISLDRSWTSCMNREGEYKDQPFMLVQVGGMAAYLINKNDQNIDKPIARIAIRRLVVEDDLNIFIFLPEQSIYGNSSIANKFYMYDFVADKLMESNEKTSGKYKSFISSMSFDCDEYQEYSDTYDTTEHINKDIILTYRNIVNGKDVTEKEINHFFQVFLINARNAEEHFFLLQKVITNEKYISLIEEKNTKHIFYVLAHIKVNDYINLVKTIIQKDLNEKEIEWFNMLLHFNPIISRLLIDNQDILDYLVNNGKINYILPKTERQDLSRRHFLYMKELNEKLKSKNKNLYAKNVEALNEFAN